MAETQNKIRRFALSSTDWTAIVAPGACNHLMIINCDPQNAICRSSDPTNPEAWCDIAAGGGYSLFAPVEGPRRFQAGDTVTYLKSYTGTPTIAVEFIL